jgi:hypothetical protein
LPLGMRRPGPASEYSKPVAADVHAARSHVQAYFRTSAIRSEATLRASSGVI